MPRSPRKPNYASIPIAAPLIADRTSQQDDASYDEDEDEKYTTSPSPPSSPSSNDPERQWSLIRTHQAEEKEIQTLRLRSRLRTKTSLYIARFRRFRWLIDFVLLLVNISLSALLLLGFWKEMDVKNTLQVGGDFGGDGPKFPTKVVRFEADVDRRYVPHVNASGGFFEGETVRAWEGLMGGEAPVVGGKGEVEETSGDGKVMFATAMSEQLRCVFLMAKIYSGVEGAMRDRLPEDYDAQFMHCVEYLRQGIMCSADMAMEPLKEEDDGGKGGNWDGYHVCKDRSHVMPYLEEQIADGIRMVRPIHGGSR
ncbi:hypothetical protein DM02DRAFT_686481 [Periconia macrospinosa]|uniref:Uncharacterized protein n=1 Tax=Periconia macrospinosa TaxID=97972 RepID=A0A2V1E558_9PLEO|nr:hypothetical protein DM02DRAFT_686481 [Periconia macrospinosa]